MKREGASLTCSAKGPLTFYVYYVGRALPSCHVSIMETVFQYEIPVYHPLAVHFPVALILVAALAMAVWAARGTAFWRQCALGLYGLGLAGGIVAYKTGEVIRAHTEGTPIVEELVGLHEDAAFYTLLLTGALLLALAGLSLWQARRLPLEHRRPVPWWARLLLALAALAAAVLVAWTAHIGGTMVWGV